MLVVVVCKQRVPLRPTTQSAAEAACVTHMKSFVVESEGALMS